MTMLQVVPDERGNWCLMEDGAAVPLSQHSSATHAEAAAWVYAAVRGTDVVLVRDRYHRYRRSVVRPAPARRPILGHELH
jgi:hypothetical protein